MYYQQQLQQERRENETQAFEQFKNSFKNDFPIRYVALHCTFMAILNVTLISTQITQIICESYMANLSIGIWSGVTNIITTYTAFILIYKQKLSLLSVSLVFHMISFVVTLVGSILQILPISQYNKSPGVFIELNVIQLFIGMVVTSMCMFFFVFMQCRGLCILKK